MIETVSIEYVVYAEPNELANNLPIIGREQRSTKKAV